MIHTIKPSRTENWPKIIWVASRPPAPPFSGITAKTLCGVNALATVTDIDLITFTLKNTKAENKLKMQEFWKNKPVKIHLIEYGRRKNSIGAVLVGRFQFGTMIENSALSTILDELSWSNPDRLLIFDDIVFAPFLTKYGHNAILSPHDCISKMSYSHFQTSPMSFSAVKNYSRYRIAQQYEKRFYHFALLVHVITQRDRGWLQQINPRARYHVIPNADLLNPGFSKTEECKWDIMVWGDLEISPIAAGSREFIRLLAYDRGWIKDKKVILIGKSSQSRAEKIIGKHLLSNVTYSSRLEDDKGKLRQAKITVVPDLGGAGTKNRCVNLLSSGITLACLYPLMEGIEKACDQGAINATNMEELVSLVKASLENGSYISIGEMGKIIFEREYSLESIRQLWHDIVRRALCIRKRI